jgi:DNA-binding HxlR family transcriptional regulator
MTSGRAYPHFCMIARALDEVGERWSLLIVRDLLLGPRRFTDLARSLGGITPSRLSGRLKRLEAVGIVLREPAATGREIWYRLTPAGEDLRSAIEGLGFWGMRHAGDPPRPGEPVHPDHTMLATKIWLELRGVRPRGGVTWVWQFADDETYTLRFAAGTWTLTRGAADAATATVITTAEVWARYLTTAPTERTLPDEKIVVGGKAAKALIHAFET